MTAERELTVKVNFVAGTAEPVAKELRAKLDQSQRVQPARVMSTGIDAKPDVAAAAPKIEPARVASSGIEAPRAVEASSEASTGFFGKALGAYESLQKTAQSVYARVSGYAETGKQYLAGTLNTGVSKIEKLITPLVSATNWVEKFGGSVAAFGEQMKAIATRAEALGLGRISSFAGAVSGKLGEYAPQIQKGAEGIAGLTGQAWAIPFIKMAAGASSWIQKFRGKGAAKSDEEDAPEDETAAAEPAKPKPKAEEEQAPTEADGIMGKLPAVSGYSGPMTLTAQLVNLSAASVSMAGVPTATVAASGTASAQTLNVTARTVNVASGPGGRSEAEQLRRARETSGYHHPRHHHHHGIGIGGVAAGSLLAGAASKVLTVGNASPDAAKTLTDSFALLRGHIESMFIPAVVAVSGFLQDAAHYVGELSPTTKTVISSLALLAISVKAASLGLTALSAHPLIAALLLGAAAIGIGSEVVSSYRQGGVQGAAQSVTDSITSTSAGMSIARGYGHLLERIGLIPEGRTEERLPERRNRILTSSTFQSQSFGGVEAVYDRILSGALSGGTLESEQLRLQEQNNAYLRRIAGRLDPSGEAPPTRVVPVEPV